jgi:hypothetical protein
VLMADDCYVGYAHWLSGGRVADYVLGGCWSLVLDVLRGVWLRISGWRG